jgi:hypothetical protein
LAQVLQLGVRMRKGLNTVLSPKVNDEQKRSNEHIRYLFIMAMMNLDDKMLLSLLDKEGKFLRCINNWQAAHWFRAKFNNFDRFGYHVKLNLGVSNEIYPGAEVFEFVYTDADFNEDQNDVFSGLPEEERKKLNKRECVLRIVVQFGKRKISDLRIINKMVTTQTAEKLQLNN